MPELVRQKLPQPVGQHAIGTVIEELFTNADGTPTDLTGATAFFSMYQIEPVIAVPLVIDKAVSAIATPATSGKVRYTFTGTQLATAGEYGYEFWVKLSTTDKRVQPVPVKGNIHVYGSLSAAPA